MTDTTTTKRKRRTAREPRPEAAGAGEGRALHSQAEQGQAKTNPAKRPTNTDTVVHLLNRNGGATLDELVEATGWLPHTTRAALTGLKKKGHSIKRTKVDGISRYALSESATQ